jgi:hypothetical protein
MPSPGTRRDDQSVVVELGPVFEADHSSVGVEGSRAVAEAELEAECVERVRCVMVDPLEVPEAGEELLGERWTVIRGVSLVTDDDHRTRVAFVADLLRRTEPSERRAHDEDGSVRGGSLSHGRSS